MRSGIDGQAAVNIAVELAQIGARQDELCEAMDKLRAEQREVLASFAKILGQLVGVVDSLAAQKQRAPAVRGPISVIMDTVFPN